MAHMIIEGQPRNILTRGLRGVASVALALAPILNVAPEHITAEIPDQRVALVGVFPENHQFTRKLRDLAFPKDPHRNGRHSTPERSLTKFESHYIV